MRLSLGLLFLLVLVGWSVASVQGRTAAHRVKSADGVDIVYDAAGRGEPALVFIHGGFADRTFWSHQMTTFAPRHRVIALDLAGHGDSGAGRKAWTIRAFAEDVRAVLTREKIRKAVVLGNSLGGPVALETARLEPARVVAVFGIDTFQDLTVNPPASYFEQRAKAFRTEFAATMKEMVRMLFHADADAALVTRVESIMLDNSPDIAAGMMESFAEWRSSDTLKQLKVPIRCVNGDLYPTAMEKNRSVYADFDAIIMPHTGHYPMLENPALFDQHLKSALKKLGLGDPQGSPHPK
jgi:pimeloyl-ACP methyl ester carboxylesterase